MEGAAATEAAGEEGASEDSSLRKMVPMGLPANTSCRSVNKRRDEGGGVGRCEDLYDVLFEAAGDDNALDTAVDGG